MKFIFHVAQGKTPGLPARRGLRFVDTNREPPENSKLMTETYSSRLAGIALPDADERDVLLGSLWAASPAVIVFLRHYG
jgi:hypothetical protein